MDEPEEPFHTESIGSSMGINPFFGEWRKRFRFPPVSYSAKSDRRREFRERVQGELGNAFYFVDEIKVEITLYIDEQKMRETDETADLDNFAKCILDSIKGKDGIIIDDCQIQSLGISWVDIYGEDEWFEVEIRGHPDEYMLKEIKLYEMPDKLWYPLSDHTWDAGRATPVNQVTAVTGPLILDAMTDFTNKLRAKLRRSGLNRTKAYRESRYHASGARGFHKSRVEGEFDLVPMKTWRNQLADLSERSGEDAKAVRATLEGFKKWKNETLSTWEEIYKKKRE